MAVTFDYFMHEPTGEVFAVCREELSDFAVGIVGPIPHGKLENHLLTQYDYHAEGDDGDDLVAAFNAAPLDEYRCLGYAEVNLLRNTAHEPDV